MSNDCLNVLFVDDETDFLQTLLKRMSKRGIDVRGAGSGEEGLERMRESTSDVVVLDVRMPGMDGIQVLREIKKNWPLTEVIMLTGHASLEAAREGMGVGAFDYLMKPVDIDELLYKIEDAFGKISIQRKKMKKLEDTAAATKKI